mmetsp:Transcript_16423/g.39411  ORF Transcript_16423/g.39411 Transcript_16423/m.39411 type:complete len:243 (+) Transcript_16423:598-1326(+)
MIKGFFLRFSKSSGVFSVYVTSPPGRSWNTILSSVMITLRLSLGSAATTPEAAAPRRDSLYLRSDSSSASLFRSSLSETFAGPRNPSPASASSPRGGGAAAAGGPADGFGGGAAEGGGGLEGGGLEGGGGLEEGGGGALPPGGGGSGLPGAPLIAVCHTMSIPGIELAVRRRRCQRARFGFSPLLQVDRWFSTSAARMGASSTACSMPQQNNHGDLVPFAASQTQKDCRPRHKGKSSIHTQP